MPIDQHSMNHNEAGCTRAFHAVTKNTGTVEQVTGFYVKRLFRSNFLDIFVQHYEEAYEGDDGHDYEAQWSNWADEVTTLQASNEEDAKSQFDEFVFLHDRVINLNVDELGIDDPDVIVIGSYDHLNGQLDLWTEELGDRIFHGVGRLKDVKALYKDGADKVKLRKITEKEFNKK